MIAIMKNNFVQSLRVFLFVFLMMNLVPIQEAISGEVEPVKDEYILPFSAFGDTSAGGISTPQFLEIIEKVFKAVEKETGIKLKLQEYECEFDKKTGREDCLKPFVKLFKEGKGDFSIAGPWDYVEMTEMGMPIKPLVAIAVDRKKTFQYCAYIRGKDREKIKSIKDLKGKSIGDASPDIGMYQMFYENGIDSDLDDFFGKRTFTPLTSALYSLVLNEVDAVAMNNGYLKFSKSQDKRFKDIVPLYCTKEEYGSGPFIYREGINPAVINKLKKLMLRMHKDQAFAEIKFLLVAINGFFVEVNDSDYDSYRALLKRAKEKGWLKK